MGPAAVRLSESATYCPFVGPPQGREGKVTQVYRKKWVIEIERITREKVNGEQNPNRLASDSKQ